MVFTGADFGWLSASTSWNLWREYSLVSVLVTSSLIVSSPIWQGKWQPVSFSIWTWLFMPFPCSSTGRSFPQYAQRTIATYFSSLILSWEHVFCPNCGEPSLFQRATRSPEDAIWLICWVFLGDSRRARLLRCIIYEDDGSIYPYALNLPPSSSYNLHLRDTTLHFQASQVVVVEICGSLQSFKLFADSSQLTLFIDMHPRINYINMFIHCP